ncbi:MAG: hypothetical protein NZ108_01850, partial [Bacteroidia bacterium]|nr:hypothetical protein [Bacteroidia bacterium]
MKSLFSSRKPLLAIFLCFFAFVNAQTINEKVYLIQVNSVAAPKDFSAWYSQHYDGAKSELKLTLDDELNFITELSDEGDEEIGLDCFIPDLKLVYREHTYIISNTCRQVKKYKNSSSFKTSNVELPSDIVYTEAFQSYVTNLASAKFGKSYQDLQVQLASANKNLYALNLPSEYEDDTNVEEDT